MLLFTRLCMSSMEIFVLDLQVVLPCSVELGLLRGRRTRMNTESFGSVLVLTQLCRYITYQLSYHYSNAAPVIVVSRRCCYSYCRFRLELYCVLYGEYHVCAMMVVFGTKRKSFPLEHLRTYKVAVDSTELLATIQQSLE